MTTTQISELYVSIFNRASEKSGNEFWASKDLTAAQIADEMLLTADATTYFGTSMDANADFVEAIYANTLNKAGSAVDADGKAYWVSMLDAGTSKGTVVAAMVDAIATYSPTGVNYDATDAATVAAYDQFTARVAVSDDAAVNVLTAPSDYATTMDFATGLTVTGAADVAAATTALVTVAATAATEAELASIDGTTFALTTSTDSFVGTSANDLFTSANGTLAAADTILDSTTTDADIMNIETTSTVGVAARMQNIETINANGTYVGVGFDATNVAGTQDLNLTTSIVGGTANVIGTSSINVANVNAGTNISTLNVTSAAGGTRDTVNVDGGAATTVNLIGDANGIDKYDATIAAGSTLAVTIGGTLGEYTANVGATSTLSVDDATKVSAYTVNTTEDSTVTIATAINDVAANLASLTFAGSGDVILDTVLAGVTAQAVSNTGTGSLTVAVSNTATTGNLQDVQADVIDLLAVSAGVTVNANSTVNLDAINTAAVIQVDNLSSATAMDNTGQGTLNLKVSENQTSVTTDDNVGTLLIEATPDSVTDTDGTNVAGTTQITVATLVADANTSTIVASGDDDLEVTLLTHSADVVFTATEMTGALTIGGTTGTTNGTIIAGASDDTIGINGAAAKTSIVLAGAGDDVLTAVAAAGTVKLYGEAGDDTISGAATASTLDGGTGNDTITGFAGADTIDGGAGDDVINAGAGGGTITTGTGADTVTLSTGAASTTVADAVSGEDVIVLTGAANNAAALNLSAVTAPVTGSYAVALGSNHTLVLTDSTATDLSAMIKLGSSTVAYAAAANLDLTAGSLDDNITTGATSGDINAGAGDDTITVTAATTGELTGGAGSDTFSIAENADILDLGATDILKVTAVATTAVSVAVVEDFTATAATSNTSTKTTLTLADGVDVDMTLATIAAATDGYIINTDATLNVITVAATIVGSRGADTITTSKYDDTITGGENADIITGGLGADTINLTESVSTVDNVVFTAQTEGSAIGVAAGSFTGFDTITGFTVGTDAILFDDANVALSTIGSAWVAGTNAVSASTDATTDALDLALTEYADVDSVVAYINDVATITATASLDIVAVTFAATATTDALTAIYLVDSADATATAGEIELLGTVDAVLTATELQIA